MKLEIRGSAQEIADFFKSFNEGSAETFTQSPTPTEPDTHRNEVTTSEEDSSPPEAPRKIGFLGEKERALTQKDDEPEGSDIERQIMNYLVEHEGTDLSVLASKVGISRVDLQQTLARMEKFRWVRSEPSGTRLLFYTGSIQRRFQKPLKDGRRRNEQIEELINKYPGITSREMGCRLLLSTEDVASTARAKENLNERWRREGRGNLQDPFRYFPIEPSEA